MRTTLDIEDDVLLAAKEISRRTRVSTGKALSDLARQSLTRPRAKATREAKAVYGFRPLPAAPGKIVTNDLIDRLRDEEGV
ncbi:MAG TPA: hypothetical protein PKC67_03235 [Kiritimatiellia bacterium]|nr:hypothetical protein [Kiritimatiellia bacterium]HMP33340.1 hypothetical protein [Kiritimatiellia bacterium]